MTSNPHLTVGEIARRYETAFLAAFGRSISHRQRRILQKLKACQTPALGGHLYHCDACGQDVRLYNSCCDRHCPSCQARKAAEWTSARLDEVLPVPYFHVVFTLPHEWVPLILQNKVLFYNILFQAVSQTLLTLAADPKRLGADIGFLTVLHTWGQNLLFHPHLHCVVPGGGIKTDGTSWVRRENRFLLPVKVLSALYRGKFLALVRRAFKAGKIQFHGGLAHLRDPEAFRELLDSVRAKDWGVNTKKPFSTPDRVVKYLARYTHRIAISNCRLVSADGGQVTFWWKDRDRANERRLMTLPATEFLRRFLLHVVPKGFVRIRYYGLFANRHRAANLQRCRELIAASATNDAFDRPDLVSESDPDRALQALPDSVRRCPLCNVGVLRYLRVLLPSEIVVTPSLIHQAKNNSS